jgi:PAS domain S-box-containing protein
MIGRTSVEVGVFSSAEERQRVFQPLLDGETMRDSEVQIRTRDGGSRTILFNAELIELGGKQCIVSLAQDITERKRAEESVKLFRMLIDHANDSIEVIDPVTGRFLDVNEKAGKLHGYTREEYLGLTIPEIDPQFAAAGEKAWTAHLENLNRFGFMVFETQHRRKDGSVFPVEINASYVRLERDYILAVVRDITEQKRAQEEMRATNRRYHRQEEALVKLTQSVALRQSLIPEMKREVTRIAAETLEVERVSIWRYERDKQSIVCQDLFERSTRLHSGGTVLHAKDFPAYFRALAAGDIIAAHDAHRDPRSSEFSETYLRPLGISSMLDTPIHVTGSVSGVICFEHVGPARQWTTDEQTFAIAVANLVSLLLAEEERQQIEGQFRQSQKMEAVGQLASGVAHDFNNILGIIQMQSDMLKTEGTLSPAQTGFASEIGEAVERAAALTRQLLLFGRKEKMQARELDLNQSINDMTKMLRRTLGGNVELQFKFSMQPLFVNADAGMIDQVLMNLAVNARDAMPKGGRIIIEASAVIFDESIKDQYVQASAGSFVCLSVSDTGSGIPPEILPKIFEPFFTTKDVGKGTGLGLATVFGIVQQHKGWINVYSEIGQGTTFRIYIPRLARISDQKFVAPLTEPASGGNETILVVEDEPKLRASVINMLSRLGYNVLEASDGANALEVWNKHHIKVGLAQKVFNRQEDEIHLLLTDMVMPGGMTGKDLGERLLKENPKLKVIYASGYSTEVAAKDFPLEEGVNFLSKPFQAQKLARIVRERLDAKI